MPAALTRLSYADICNRDIVPALMTEDRFRTGKVVVEFSDGQAVMPVRYALLHIIFWYVYVRLGIPLRKDHIFRTKGVYSYKEIFAFFTKIYQECIRVYPDRSFEVKDAIWDTINFLQNFCAIELTEYQSSLSIRELVDILDDPQVQKLTSIDLRPEHGTDAIETKLKVAGEQLVKLIATPGAIKNNVLLPYQLAGLLNVNQIPQMFIALGTRTDINDNLVMMPVQESVIGGIRSIVSFAIESLSARKSTFYNAEAISDAQYFNRKQQLATSGIRHIYRGDCGTRLTIPFLITGGDKGNWQNILQKNIVDGSTGEMILLTEDNIQQYWDTVVNMRSPFVCRHTDGVCECCGGELTRYICPDLDIGILCATHVVEPVTQKILSTKHQVKTRSLVYVIPERAQQVFTRQSNMLFWQPEIVQPGSAWWVGIHHNDIKSLRDLQYIHPDAMIQEEQLSTIRQLWIRNEAGETCELAMQVDSQCPYLSLEALMYMREHYSELEITEDMIWIPMQNYDPQRSFMRTVVANDSMMAFVNSVTSFLSSKIDKYRSVERVLRDFSQVVFNKVSTNIFHLEVLLRTYLVNSASDYSIPIVDDPDNVRFSTTPKIITNRAISPALGFEDHRRYLSSPLTFTVPKDASIWDIHFGI